MGFLHEGRKVFTKIPITYLEAKFGLKEEIVYELVLDMVLDHLLPYKLDINKRLLVAEE